MTMFFGASLDLSKRHSFDLLNLCLYAFGRDNWVCLRKQLTALSWAAGPGPLPGRTVPVCNLAKICKTLSAAALVVALSDVIRTVVIKFMTSAG